MKISETWRYDAQPEQVWAMLTDTAFQDRKCAESGALSHETSVEPATDGGATIVASRTMPSDGLPDQLKRFVSDGLVVVETQTWGAAAADGARTGKAHVAIKGTPMTMKGSLSLAPDGGGTTLAISADLKAGIPLVGGQIEKAAAPAIVAGIKVEQEEGAAYLAGS